MGEYTLKFNIKADPKDLKDIGDKIGKNIKSDKKGTTETISSDNTGVENKGLLDGLKSLGLALGVIGAAVYMLKDLLAPILSVLQVMLTVIFVPMISLLLGLLRPFLLLSLKLLTSGRGASETIQSGAEVIGKSMTGGLDQNPFEPTFNAFNNFKTALDEGNGGLAALIGFFGIFGAAINVVTAVVWVVINVFRLVWEGGIKLGAWLVGAGAWLGDLFIKLFDFLGKSLEIAWGILKSAWDLITLGLSEIWNGLKAVWGYFTDGLNIIWETLKLAWSWITDGLDTIWSSLKTAWGWITSGLEAIWNTLKLVWSSFTDGLDTIWKALKVVWDSFTNGLSKIWTTLKSVFDGLISAVRWVIDKIPFLNSGDKSSKAFGGMIPESGSYYLHQGERVVPNSFSGNNSSNQTINITINGSVDQTNINELVRKISRELSRRTGAW